MYSLKAQESQLIQYVRQDFFSDYDCRDYIGKIDFSVAINQEGKELFDKEYVLWAEAKKGNKNNYHDAFVQLIFTIGKERPFEKFLPPLFLGVFDAEQIAFIPYSAIMAVFTQHDFNWNVPPSDHTTKEFKQLKEMVTAELAKANKEKESVFVFNFFTDKRELKKFIRKNFVSGGTKVNLIRINQNNFTHIYEKWREQVKPTIQIDWKEAEKYHIYDSHFYLADLMSENGETLLKSLKVLLKSDHYALKEKINDHTLFGNSIASIEFTDEMVAHRKFWSKYERPPRKEYQEKIVDRQDLLVPPNIREEKGSYYTPRIWVEKSQEYLAEVLGDNWQDEYYIWDCCAGTGNLLRGLSNKYNLWASELFDSNVRIMHQQIDDSGEHANLLKEHVFQFDFLNDDFTKLPQGLQDIINDEEKRKKLVIYINPPFVEVSSINGGKKGVNQSAIHAKYTKMLGTAGREIYTQFLIRIYFEIRGCIIAEFSKLKTLQGAAFKKYRDIFQPKLCRMFIVPGKTFDNVKGKFPIGFKIWDSTQEDRFSEIITDVYDAKGNELPSKFIYLAPKNGFISNWVSTFKSESKERIGFLCGTNGNDFQHNNIVYILNKKEQMANPRGIWITNTNIIECSIYFAVRKVIDASWVNDRDQFLYPLDNWKYDRDFQYNCLVYTLFGNNIQSEYGINHWIPFTEFQVKATNNFQSHFMSDFIAGKMSPKANETLFDNEVSLIPSKPIIFTPAAQAVMDAGRKIWIYYFDKIRNTTFGTPNVNASFYDIRAYFQCHDEKGKMKNESKDETYMSLLRGLRSALKILAKQIEQKVYLYGFLKGEVTYTKEELAAKLLEAEKKNAALEHRLQTVQQAQTMQIVGGNVTYNDYSTNYNIKK